MPEELPERLAAREGPARGGPAGARVGFGRAARGPVQGLGVVCSEGAALGAQTGDKA